MHSQVAIYIRNHQWADALFKKMSAREPPTLNLLKPGRLQLMVWISVAQADLNFTHLSCS